MKHFQSQSFSKKWMLLLAFLFFSPFSDAEETQSQEPLQIKVLIARPDGKMDENAVVPTQPTAEYSTLMILESSSQSATGPDQFPYALYSKLTSGQKFVIQRHLLARIKETQILSLKNYNDDNGLFSKHQISAMAHRMMFLLLPLNQGESVRICIESGSKMPDHIKKELGILEKISNETLEALRSIIRPADLSIEPTLNYRIQLVAKSAQPIPNSCLQFEKVDLSTADISKPGQKPQKKRPVTPARKSSN
jgi:hypothetical protein